jgi:enterochelin esterase-like enzyme
VSKHGLLAALLAAVMSGPLFAAGTLHGPERISSEILGYDLQYWIYMPGGEKPSVPELYVTDGAGYLGPGNMVEVLDREIEAGNINATAAIFVDSRDPDTLSVDRRAKEFMCNANYARFFLGELMPEISERWTGGGPSTRRGLMGVSFGAINAACFGVLMPGVFQVLILHSPGSPAHLQAIRDLYNERPTHSSGIFISHGGPDDNAAAVRRFVSVLEHKGYPVQYVTNDGAHDWNNWASLVDISLRAFTGTQEGERLEDWLPEE